MRVKSEPDRRELPWKQSKPGEKVRAEMLYYLFFYILKPFFSPLNVFRYITVRTAVASVTALLLSLFMKVRTAAAFRHACCHTRLAPPPRSWRGR